MIGDLLPIKDVDGYDDLTVETAGLLVGEDDRVLRIAMDYWRDAGDDTITVRRLEVIPKFAVRKEKRWKLPK